MKKLLLASALFAICFSGKSQTNTAVIMDTLHYYLNKQYFKTGDTALAHYPYFETNATALASSTAITYCGAKFEVPAGESVLITGLEAFASKAVTTAGLTVPIRLYLFKVNASTGMPIMPPVDSVNTTVGANSVYYPAHVGGDFTNTLTIGARVMTSTYAVAMRNMSGISGDYAKLLRTDAVTQNNPNGPKRYSDNYGFVRYQGTFYSTTDFSLTAGYGVGTAYEFMVAPRVIYTVQASQLLPTGVVSVYDTVNVADTMCTRLPLTYTNTSSKFFEHRQYNLNQFYRKWNLYDQLYFQNSFSSDSSITWSFEYYDNVPQGHDSRVFLPYSNNETINAMTGYAVYPNCFTDNEFRARLKPMGAKGRVPQYVFNEKFIVCLKYCNGDTTGIKKLNNYNNLKIYPNPAVNGKTTISGLKGMNKIMVYNMLGEVVSNETTDNSSIEVNLTKQPKGTYVVRITNSANNVRVVKILNENN